MKSQQTQEEKRMRELSLAVAALGKTLPKKEVKPVKREALKEILQRRAPKPRKIVVKPNNSTPPSMTMQILQEKQSRQSLLDTLVEKFAPHFALLKTDLEAKFDQMATKLIEESTQDIEITDDTVRQIIQVMKKLPTNDRLEIQDIRNYQSFLFNGKRYDVSELMHGGGSSGTNTATNVVTEYDLQTKTQNGSDVVVPLSQLTHFAQLVNVVSANRNQIPQTNGITCTITATDVTFLNADVSEVFSITYVYES